LIEIIGINAKDYKTIILINSGNNNSNDDNSKFYKYNYSKILK